MLGRGPRSSGALAHDAARPPGKEKGRSAGVVGGTGQGGFRGACTTHAHGPQSNPQETPCCWVHVTSHPDSLSYLGAALLTKPQSCSPALGLLSFGYQTRQLLSSPLCLGTEHKSLSCHLVPASISLTDTGQGSGRSVLLDIELLSASWILGLIWSLRSIPT